MPFGIVILISRATQTLRGIEYGSRVVLTFVGASIFEQVNSKRLGACTLQEIPWKGERRHRAVLGSLQFVWQPPRKEGGKPPGIQRGPKRGLFENHRAQRLPQVQ